MKTKNFTTILAVVLVAVSLSGCLNPSVDNTTSSISTQKPVNNEYDEMVRRARDLLKETWTEQTKEGQTLALSTGPSVKITNTRVIKLKDNPVMVENNNNPVEELEGIDCIVELMLITNLYGDSYPSNTYYYDTVTVRNDGSMEVQKSNLLNLIRSRYYLSDYSGIIDEIIDLEDGYSGELF